MDRSRLKNSRKKSELIKVNGFNHTMIMLVISTVNYNTHKPLLQTYLTVQNDTMWPVNLQLFYVINGSKYGNLKLTEYRIMDAKVQCTVKCEMHCKISFIFVFYRLLYGQDSFSRIFQTFSWNKLAKTAIKKVI